MNFAIRMTEENQKAFTKCKPSLRYLVAVHHQVIT